MAVTMIHDSAKPGTIPGTQTIQLHYLLHDAKNKVVLNVIRQKPNVPAGHVCFTQPNVTAKLRAEHSEAADRGAIPASDFYYPLVSRTIWTGAGNPPTPPLPDVVHVHHETTIYRDRPNDSDRGGDGKGGGWNK